MAKRAALYARVSTRNGHQDPEVQLMALRQVAERAGWQVVEEYVDHGISGAKGRDKRPAFDRLLKDATRRRFDIIMAWSVDRLGRSLQDLVGFFGDVHAQGIDLYLDRQGVDTTTPGGKALFQMMGVFASARGEETSKPYRDRAPLPQGAELRRSGFTITSVCRSCFRRAGA